MISISWKIKREGEGVSWDLEYCVNQKDKETLMKKKTAGQKRIDLQNFIIL